MSTIRSVSGDFFTFQQDSAPAHRARETIALYYQQRLLTSSVHWSGQWPSNSTDLNTAHERHDAIWKILQERFYHCKISRNIDHLNERLIEEWRRFDQNIIDGEVISGVIDCVNVPARNGDTFNI